jgi:uncharacterized membrane protein YeaQ/YmgE (transglycosylase-associated protein family)
MGVIYAIVVGFIVGILARFLKPGDDRMGFVLTTLLGIVGAFVGAYLGQLFGIYRPDEPAGFIASVVGAVLVLAIVQAAMGRRRVLP